MESRTTLGDIQHALEVLAIINELALTRGSLTYSTLYTKALASELVMPVRKLPSDQMLQLLERLQAIPCFPAADVASDLDLLRNAAARADDPLRSTYDVRARGHPRDRPRPARRPRQGQGRALHRRGRVLAAHRPRRPRAPRLPRQDARPAEGAPLLRGARLRRQDREALGGSPRAAIERALSRPHDYLACECCD